MSHPITKIDPAIASRIEVRIPVSHLKAAAVTAVKAGEARYYLRNVWIEASLTETRAVGTDGSVMVAVRFENESNQLPLKSEFNFTFGLMVPTAVIDAIKVHSRNHLPVAVIQYAGNDEWRLTVRDQAGLGQDLSQQIFRTPDGVFPDYRRVIPSTAAGNKLATEPQQFNPDNAALVQKAARLYGSKSAVVFAEHFDRQVRFLLPSDDGFVGLIMEYSHKNGASTSGWFKDWL